MSRPSANMGTAHTAQLELSASSQMAIVFASEQLLTKGEEANAPATERGTIEYDDASQSQYRQDQPWESDADGIVWNN